MSKTELPVRYFQFEIKLDDQPSFFKVSAFNVISAAKICKDYFSGKKLEIISHVEGRWK